MPWEMGGNQALETEQHWERLGGREGSPGEGKAPAKAWRTPLRIPSDTPTWKGRLNKMIRAPETMPVYPVAFTL